MEKSLVNREQFFKHIQIWESSGQTQKQYCQVNQLGYGTFTYYRKRYKASREKTFLQLKVDKPITEGCFVSIELPNKSVLKIHQKLEAAFLADIISSCK